MALECCLKAAIMKKYGYNRWPALDERPDLWVHNLRDLAQKLGIEPKTFPPADPAAAAWRLALTWERQHGYNVNKLPSIVATQMYEAAFGADGVVEWLAKRFLLNI